MVLRRCTRFKSQFKSSVPLLSPFRHASLSLLRSLFEAVIVVLSVGFYPINSMFIQYIHIFEMTLPLASNPVDESPGYELRKNWPASAKSNCLTPMKYSFPSAREPQDFRNHWG